MSRGPMLAKSRVRVQCNAGPFCDCQNLYPSTKHGSKKLSRGRKQEKQRIRRIEERLWRKQEEL